MLITMKSIEKIPGSFLILEDGLVDNGCFFRLRPSVRQLLVWKGNTYQLDR